MTNIGILLAAGFGRRYANASQGANKLLAPLPDGTSVASTSAKSLRLATDFTLAVVRPNSPELSAQLYHQGCHVLETSEAQYGMGASLAAAAHYLLSQPNLPLMQTPSALLVALADMPWIKNSTYHLVLSALYHHRIAAPIFKAKRGHPVGFQARLLFDLSQLSGDIGAKKLIEQYGIHPVPCDDAGVLQDIDLPTDLQKKD